LPSGKIEPGESVTEACVREVLEETGLNTEVVKLIGVYSNPHQLVEYPNGNRIHLISLCFEVKVTGGKQISQFHI
jgi:ADP-ribose pyrophosphatase YjhB (NUDIX family)